MESAFIIDGVRTPIGNHGGALATVRPDDLAAHVIRALMARHPNLPSEAVAEIVFGSANQAGEDNRNVARMAGLLAGLPVTVPGVTINRLCASGLSAVLDAGRLVSTGDAAVVVAGGVESMTRAPFVLGKAATPFARTADIFDTSIGWRFVNPRMKEIYGIDSMGQTAENVAEKHGINRLDQDTFAVRSQHKAAAARDAGRFASEIVPVSVPGAKGSTTVVEHDEFIRPGTTLEALQKLKPAFRTDGNGSVTAGNASGINDGACAVLVAGESAAAHHGLTPLARIVASAAVGVEPKYMGIGPVGATERALARAGLTLRDIAVIELNEAFAAQSLACTRALGLADDDPRVNPNGGAIALGHPLGMSGARLVLTAALELKARRERYALCTMCVGVGQGVAAIIERV
jgi:3-oxoadipyl-CoA thiolase